MCGSGRSEVVPGMNACQCISWLYERTVMLKHRTCWLSFVQCTPISLVGKSELEAVHCSSVREHSVVLYIVPLFQLFPTDWNFETSITVQELCPMHAAATEDKYIEVLRLLLGILDHYNFNFTFQLWVRLPTIVQTNLYSVTWAEGCTMVWAKTSTFTFRAT